MVNACIEVHRTLSGLGLLESIYEAAMSHELTLQGLRVQRQVPVQVVYKEMIIREPLYVDILVNNKVIIENTSLDKFIKFIIMFYSNLISNDNRKNTFQFFVMYFVNGALIKCIIIIEY